MSKPRESLLPPLWILSVVGVLGLGWLTVQLKELVVLLVIGYFIAYAIHPLLVRLEGRGISRTWGFAIISASFVSAIVVLCITAVPAIVSEFERLNTNLHRYLEIGGARLGPIWENVLNSLPLKGSEGEELSQTLGRLPQVVAQLNGEGVKRLLSAVGATLMHGYNRVLTLFNIALLPFIVYYLAIDLPKIYSGLVTLVPLTRRTKFLAICSEVDQYISAFVRGQVIVCSILFVLYALGLWVIGVDLWLLLAALSGFGNVIPYFGFIAGIVLSSLMALVTFGDLAHLLWVWGVYGAVQVLEGTFITPKVVGDSVGLSPLVVILAIFAGGQLCGLLGVFLAIPTAAVLRVLGRFSYQWLVNR